MSARDTVYEWLVEQVDRQGDIIETSAFETLEEAQAFDPEEGLTKEIALRRDVWCIRVGLVERQHAYPGDTEFEHGAKIPADLLAQLNSLVSK